MIALACSVQGAIAQSKPTAASDTQAQPEDIIVTTAGLYGDWKMVLPDWPGADKPVTGDFCNFKERGDGVAIICADDFLQEVPDVTLDDNKLRMRWGGALTHTIYDAVWEGSGTFDGEIVQAQMGLVAHRFKAQMQRVSEQPSGDAPQSSVTALNNYLAKRGGTLAGSTAKYYGRILEQRGDREPTFPDVFKVSNAGGAEQWCLVRVNADGPADVRCRDIP